MSDITATHDTDTGELKKLVVTVGPIEVTFVAMDDDMVTPTQIQTRDLNEGYDPVRAYADPQHIGEALRLAELVDGVKYVRGPRDLAKVDAP